MLKRIISLLVMVLSGVVVYALFRRPELAMWRDTLLALLKSLSK